MTKSYVAILVLIVSVGIALGARPKLDVDAQKAIQECNATNAVQQSKRLYRS